MLHLSGVAAALLWTSTGGSRLPKQSLKPPKDFCKPVIVNKHSVRERGLTLRLIPSLGKNFKIWFKHWEPVPIADKQCKGKSMKNRNPQIVLKCYFRHEIEVQSYEKFSHQVILTSKKKIEKLDSFSFFCLWSLW